jgi:DnaJ homolog subfamily A member 5
VGVSWRFRAMEKENKKLRDVGRKKYIETVRALAEYVKKRDVRVLRMEAERKKKAREDEELREERK